MKVTVTAAALIVMGPTYCKMPFVRSDAAEEQLPPVFAYAAGKLWLSNLYLPRKSIFY